MSGTLGPAWLAAINGALQSAAGQTSAVALARFSAQGVPSNALVEWMANLYLLDSVPFTYLVPDPALLPAESIRFFYLDHDWCERLTDGVLNAGGIGGLDEALSQGAIAALRTEMYTKLLGRKKCDGDARAAWRSVPICGLLLRSEAVRRWPKLEVRAWRSWCSWTPSPECREPEKHEKHRVPENQLRRLRLERLSDTVLIALFQGVPEAVEIQEPNEGTRFGVEGNGGVYGLDPWRRQDGTSVSGRAPVALRASDKRVLDVGQLRAELGARAVAVLFGDPDWKHSEVTSFVPSLPDTVNGRTVRDGKEELFTRELAGYNLDSAFLALNLQQLPYCHVFRGI